MSATGPPTPIVEATFPARVGFLPLVRTAARVAYRDLGRGGWSVRDLVLAVDELAAVLIVQAPADAQLHLSIVCDDDDLYVRMRTASEDPLVPRTPELTAMLLQATTDSFDVRSADGEVVGVLQLRLDGA